MISVLYEDQDIIVVEKPAGMESQSSRGFGADMVSELRGYLISARRPQVIHKAGINNPRRPGAPQPPYVGVIHRLDKPVGGIMVYGKTPRASAALSASLQAGEINKRYLAVVCGKPVDNQGAYVDYLLQDRKNNRSDIVDKSVPGSKKGELNYRVRQVIHREVQGQRREYALVEVELLTGRHHQIRVQFAGHGTPLYGDSRYGDIGTTGENRRSVLGLWAFSLSFFHPSRKSRCILRKNRPEKYFPGFLCKAEEKGLTPVPFSAIFVLIN